MSNTAYINTSWGEMAFSKSDGADYPLIFLHGTGCDSLDWMSVIDRLPGNQVHITTDFRGHGNSSIPIEPFTINDLANDVIHLIDSIDIQRTILVGHSLGGMVAMSVADRCSLITGLVLLEGWTSLLSAGSSFDDGRFYGSLPKAQISEIKQKSEETRKRFKPDVWNSFWTSVKDFDGFSFLEKATIPILEVFGGMGKNEYTEEKLRIPPNSNVQVVWINGAGHYLPHESPTEVAELCTNLVEEL